MLEAGFDKLPLTIPERMPLAGYFRWHGERLAEGRRDPLYVRAVAFKEGGVTLVLLIYDLLVITDELARALRERLAEPGRMILVHATHTHSAPGGYWGSFPATLAFGKLRQGFLDSLVSQGEKAARGALGDLAPASFAATEVELPELARNRRDEAGPVDAGLFSLHIKRGAPERDALLVGFSAHPVIVAERAGSALSADFPGAIVAKLERNVGFAAFVNGALGGADVVFPKEAVSAASNLAMMAEPISQAALSAFGAAHQAQAGLVCRHRERPLPHKPQVTVSFADQRLGRLAFAPLDFTLSLAFRLAALDRYRLQAFALGSTLFLGTPADCGVSLALAIKRYARERGFQTPFVASQCDGYIGYVHRLSDYARVPKSATRGMAYYENAMGIYGHEMGERLLDEACRLIDDLVYLREKGGRP